MENKPQTREEKIAFLKNLVTGRVRIQNIIPRLKLCLFEIEPGEYFGFVDGYPQAYYHVGPFEERLKEGIIARIRRKCKRDYPDSLFENDTMPYEECKRLREYAQKEF